MKAPPATSVTSSSYARPGWAADAARPGWWPTRRDLAAMVGLADVDGAGPGQPVSAVHHSGRSQPAQSDSLTVVAARLTTLFR